MRSSAWLTIVSASFAAAVPVCVAQQYAIDLPVTYNERNLKDIAVSIQSGEVVSVVRDSLLDSMKRLLNDETLQRLSTYEQSMIPLSTLEDSGIFLTFSVQNMSLTLKLAGTALRPTELDYGGQNELVLPDETASWATLNRFNLLTETIDSDTQVALEWLGSVNFGGYDGVNMRWSGFADRDNEGDNTFYRGEITLYHDDPVKPMRYELGDLTTFTSGHVSGLNMGGIGISRAYRELQPRREISPGNTQQFYLPSSADVEIQVNGFTVLRQQFNPGRYELNDLPLTSGANEVLVIATFEDGTTQTFQFDNFYSGALLRKGLSDFALRLGYASEFEEFSYDYEDELTLSGYYDYGFSDAFTAGINAELSSLGHIAGTTLSYGFSVGVVTLRGSHSKIESYDGYAASIDMGFSVWGSGYNSSPNLRFSYETRSDFAPTVAMVPLTLLDDKRFTADYSYYFNDDLDLTASVSRYEAVDGTEIDIDSLRMSYRRRGWLFSAEYYRSNFIDPLTQQQDGVFFSISWNGYDSRSQIRSRAEYDDRREQTQLSYGRINRNRVGNYGYEIYGIDNAQIRDIRASASYTGNRGRAELTASQLELASGAKFDIYRTALSSTLGIADGQVGVGSIVETPFALVRKHHTLANSTVQVNPDYLGEIEAKAGETIAGMVSLGAPFSETSVLVNVPDAPLGYNWGPGLYDSSGGSTTGRVITVGSDAAYLVLGYIYNHLGQPLSLERGELRGEGRVLEVFTNRRGRFAVEGIAPGRYQLVIGGLSADVVLTATEENLIDAGVITVSEVKP
ncbi:hypothetical protein C5610_01895 [Idiomarina sp. OT37-5b]|jgi:outer membrane usher protein|uniref:fimbria/pilus outer membrane usher protein n=1 Tax=Idiomarina sp. OT37-5b TaxID=2100422 RepID=UPI000CF94574|nr:fimbria/pilus outer membrane usher protein [Idiomarina sp. OT37-5b]AVJ55160.1 hypothetical protein C5610_01895 [Idiomarina sp. OT37-5b]